MFCNIWNESIGRVGEKLVGGGHGHFPEWCDLHSVCHDPKPDPNRSKWDYDISEDMKHFEMALFDRSGRWTQNVCPLDYDAHSIGVHPTAAVVLAFFFLRLPIGQYGPVSQLSRSEESCTGPFNWGEAHCAGEKVKRKIGPFQWKSL